MCAESFNGKIWQLQVLPQIWERNPFSFEVLGKKHRNIEINQNDLFGINMLKEMEKHFLLQLNFSVICR